MDVTFGSILIRASIFYIYVLALVRISGKQSISQLSSMDFVVATIIGDQFDSVIYGEVPIPQGMVGFGTIVLIHMLVTFAGSRNTFVHNFFSPPPALLVQHGTLLQTGLQNEWMNVDTLQSEMRLQGEDQVEEVREARLEPHGQLSILKNDPARPAQKQDRALLR